MSNQKQISTTALTKKYNIPTKEMFAHLLQKGLIEKKGDIWSLTNQGVDAGGKFVTSKKFGKYMGLSGSPKSPLMYKSCGLKPLQLRRRRRRSHPHQD